MDSYHLVVDSFQPSSHVLLSIDVILPDKLSNFFCTKGSQHTLVAYELSLESLAILLNFSWYLDCVNCLLKLLDALKSLSAKTRDFRRFLLKSKFIFSRL